MRDGPLPKRPAPERGEQMLKALYERLHDAANHSHIVHVSTHEPFGKIKVSGECVVMFGNSCAILVGIYLWWLCSHQGILSR